MEQATEARPAPTYPPLREVLREYQTIKRLKPRTSADYLKCLERYWADYLPQPVSALTPNAVLERFRTISSPSWANYSLRIIRALYRFYNAAHDDCLPIPTAKTLALDGAHSIQARSRLIHDHQQPVWHQALVEKAGPTGLDLFRLIALTGLRLGEALRLRWEDIDLVGAALTVLETKNGRSLTLPLGRRTATLLEARKSVAGVAAGPVFCINPRNVRKVLKKTVDASGIEWSAHDLRRGYASLATRLNVPDRIVKRLVNHTESDVTGKHYIHLGPDALRPHAQAIEDALWGLWKGPEAA